MSKDWKAIAAAVTQHSATLYKHSPKVVRSFNELATATMTGGALSKKHKELMAFSIAVITQCDGCIAYHCEAAIRAGASREEFVETLNVAIELGGGPALITAGEALEAYEALSA